MFGKKKHAITFYLKRVAFPTRAVGLAMFIFTLVLTAAIVYSTAIYNF